MKGWLSERRWQSLTSLQKWSPELVLKISVITGSSVASRNMMDTQDADFLWLFALKFQAIACLKLWVIFKTLSRPTTGSSTGSWWSQWGVLAASSCYSWWIWSCDTLWDTHKVMTTFILVVLVLVLPELTQSLPSNCCCGVLYAVSWICNGCCDWVVFLDLCMLVHFIAQLSVHQFFSPSH